MKSFLAYMALFFSSFFIVPYHWYLQKLAKKNPKEAWERSYRLVKGFFNAELKLVGCKITVLGEENIPKDTACLFVGNHRSYFDILVSHNTVGFPAGFIAKAEMRKVPLLRLYMKDIGCLFLERDNIKQGLETINKGAEYMKQGHSMILFPEGHRNQTDEFLPFKEGGYKMADKSGCPIVPFAISGTDLIYESAPGKKFTKGNVIIEYGKPIYPNEYPMKERKAKYKEIPDIIKEMRSKHKLKK